MGIGVNRGNRSVIRANACQARTATFRCVRGSAFLANGVQRLVVCALVFGSLSFPLLGYTHIVGLPFRAEPYDERDANGHFVQDFKREYFFDFYNAIESVPVYFMVYRNYLGAYCHYEYQVSGAQRVYSTRHLDLYAVQVPLSGGHVVVTEYLKSFEKKARNTKAQGAKEQTKNKQSDKKKRTALRWPKISVSGPISLCINLVRNPVPPMEKTNTGALISLNDDDDDKNGLADWMDKANGGKDNELVQLNVQHPPGVPFSLSWDPTILRLYKTPTKKYKGGYSSLMGNGGASYKGYDNQVAYVEGIAPGVTFLTITGPGGFKDSLKISVSQIGLAMDGNRDGVISFTDPADTNYVFWVNDDRDQMHFEANECEWHEDDVAVNGLPDCDNDTIGEMKGKKFGCRRDLEDFMRLHIRIDANTANQPGISYHLIFNNPIGSPQVNLFEAVDGSLAYLQDSSIADWQIKKKRLATIGVNEYQLPNKYIKPKYDCSCFLLEGRKIGKGNLTLILRKDGSEICRKNVMLELRPIDWFFQRFKVASVGEKSMLINNCHSDFTRSDEYLLFVHGFNVDQTEKACWPATVFKRLWWQNYKGHVGFFDWPCELLDYENPQCYDDSEYNAWCCGEALLDRINQLNADGHSGNVRLLAHSQGNVVAGEALRRADRQVVHTYIASQAAISADCYQLGIVRYFKSYSTPNVFVNYPPTSLCYLSNFQAKAGRRFSYFNREDYALHGRYSIGSWEWNNAARPDIPYWYRGSRDTYDPLAKPKPSVFVYDEDPDSLPMPREMFFAQDTFEIFSYAAEARGAALGVQSNMDNFVTFNLNDAPLGYNDAHYSHSRQFRSNITDEWIYWVNVCKDCQFDLSRTQ